MNPVLDEITHKILVKHLMKIVSETNGVSLSDTLKLMNSEFLKREAPRAWEIVVDFQKQLSQFQQNKLQIQQLLAHEFSQALFEFFKHFPLKFSDDHLHLTGSLNADFLFPRIQELLTGPHKEIYKKKLVENYGSSCLPIKTVEDVDKLIRIKDGEGFMKYLSVLYLPKLVLVDRKAHSECAYHIASELFNKFNVGSIRLKFTLSRSSSSSADQVPGSENLTSEDVVLGLYDGFKTFKDQNPKFKFILSPSFRKEATFFDSTKYSSRKEHFEAQVEDLVKMVDNHSYLQGIVCEVDTVGSENELYRKEHFKEFERGFRKLQYRGFKIRSHHGETFHTLKKGIQAVDNAMNIWHIDTVEHGLSLGINPNFYFHKIYQSIFEKNYAGKPITAADPEYKELIELDWGPYKYVLDKLFAGNPLNDKEHTHFVKAKFHTAREVEHYQHDVLNRMIQKGANLISLPSSNNKLTGRFEDYKDHPFSWWEKKGMNLGVGTDNYITLNTNFIQEMLIILFTDPEALKITKLLMVTTGENRRPYIAHLLWKMRKLNLNN
jgi:adenosine deaminase